MEVGQIVTGIGIAAGICSMMFGYIGYQAGVRRDSIQSGREAGTITTDIHYMMRRMDETLLEVKGITNTLNNYGERIARVEESSKSAHKRINEIVGKPHEEEE